MNGMPLIGKNEQSMDTLTRKVFKKYTQVFRHKYFA